MTTAVMIKLLEEMALLLEIDGANPFKSGAYHKAVRGLESFTGNVELMAREGKLTEIEGVGKGIAEKMDEFFKTGRIGELEELRGRIPMGVVSMTRISGFGPKKARAVYTELGIDTLDKLKKACEDGSLAELKGFGAKTAEKVLLGIEQLDRFKGQHRLDTALSLATPILSALREFKAVQQVELAGSLRRTKEIVKDIDFVCATTDPAAVMDFFTTLPSVVNILGKGETKSSIQLEEGIQADLRCITPEQWPYALLHFTGSKEHNTALRTLAKEKGLKLSEYGLFPEGTEESLPAATEADIYTHLGCAFIPPPLREAMGEVEASREGRLPKLATESAFRGLLHMHTVFSDGKPTLEQYAEWAAAKGLEWMGIADHSRSLTVANGLSMERVLDQHREIDAVNARWKSKGVRLIKGIESDILADGSLDYPEDFLPNFEWIVASIHTLFNLTEKEQTMRLCRAAEHPATTVMGHLTGRLLLAREGYPCDQREVIRIAARAGTAIEINANPWRLDLDWRLVHYAIEQGCRLCISPDAHKMEGLDDTKYGLAMAQKGWATDADLLNTLSAEAFMTYARNKSPR